VQYYRGSELVGWLLTFIIRFTFLLAVVMHVFRVAFIPLLLFVCFSFISEVDARSGHWHSGLMGIEVTSSQGSDIRVIRKTHRAFLGKTH